MVKNLPAVQEIQIQSLGQEDPLERTWPSTPVFLPGESHEQKSLAASVHKITQNRKRLKWLSIQEIICPCIQFENLAYLIFILPYLTYLIISSGLCGLESLLKICEKGKSATYCCVCVCVFLNSYYSLVKFLLFRLTLLK